MRVSDNTSFQAIVTRTLILKTKACVLFLHVQSCIVISGMFICKKAVDLSACPEGFLKNL